MSETKGPRASSPTLDIATLVPLCSLSSEERRAAAPHCRLLVASAGKVLYDVGERCSHFLVVVDGAVTVRQTTATGRNLVLYRLATGEACALTTMALLGGDLAHHVAQAVADSETRVLAIPVTVFLELMEQSQAFRRFAIAACAARFRDLLQRIDRLSQHRIDSRLAETLLAKSVDRQSLHISHTDLAAEVGTAREVVSRQLARFDQQGWIQRNRGGLTVLNRAALVELLRARD